MRRGVWHSAVVLLAGAPLFSGCCGSPSAANSKLRKENQDLQGQVQGLKTQLAAAQTNVAAWERRSPNLPTLPPDRLADLFTVHGLKFERLTGGDRLNPTDTWDDAIRLFIAPTDQTGDPLKAAGSFNLTAYDLAAPQPNEIGHWTFPLKEAASLWGGSFLSTGYVLTCPLKEPPRHSDITVHVEFTDALTQAQFVAQTIVKLKLPATTQPAFTAR